MQTRDAATFSYADPLRRMLRGSDGHSMPSCGADDLQQLSAFLWSRNSAGARIPFDQAGLMHFAYQRTDGAKIERILLAGSNGIMLLDRLTGGHAANKLRVRWLVEAEGGVAPPVMVGDASGDWVERAQKRSLQPFSPEYGVLQPNASLAVDIQVDAGQWCLTLFAGMPETASEVIAILSDLVLPLKPMGSISSSP
jgi:hypothetical protein